MKALFIGGTGNISTACTLNALEKGWEVYHINRGVTQYNPIKEVHYIKADITDRTELMNILKDYTFDVVVNFIAFTPQEIEQDFQLFRNKTSQYIFISSASVYQKPVSHPVITESTPLCNPYWDYSQNKILAEEKLQQLYRDHNFPITIVRPSLTYQFVIPVAIGSWTDFTIVDRIRKGKPIIVHGDGTSLWTVTHSEDFAKGFVGLMGHQQAIGHAFHITSDEILTWNQIYQAVALAAGREPKIVHVASDFICDVADKLSWKWMRGNLLGDKAVSVIFDNTKIKTFVPGFSATIPFKEGIKRTINWFDADASRQIISEENNMFIDSVLSAYLKSS
jgi:nucleoside-diphosphate-sugar epimerase